MKEISDKELLQLQLDILRDVDSFCRKNGIEYFLVGGTGIGAVRHGGYIPWDDDIDIGMTRPNYDRFIKLFNGTYNNLKVYAPEEDWDYYAPYANVCDTRTILDEGANGHNGKDVGVKIDIFPYDGVSSGEDFEMIRRQSLKLNSYTVLKRQKIHKLRKKTVRLLLSIIYWKLRLLPISYKTLQQKIYSLSKQVPFVNAEYLEKIVFPYRNNIPCRKEIFESYIDMPFEYLIVRNIKEYDIYLRSVFGDYMQLPPKEQQIPHHGFKAYWKD